jgi:hypothetical protein
VADDLCDDEFVRQFESCTFPAQEFHHRDHVRLAWLYLREHEPLAALSRFSDSLKRFAASHGKPGLYHETITWAFLLLIRERMQRKPSADFETFARENGELLQWQPSILERYYQAETLRSDLARHVFLMPDRM